MVQESGLCNAFSLVFYYRSAADNTEHNVAKHIEPAARLKVSALADLSSSLGAAAPPLWTGRGWDVALLFIPEYFHGLAMDG